MPSDRDRQRKARRGLSLRRLFTTSSEHPSDTVAWERRVARTRNSQGDVIFEQGGVEVPKTWSQTATDVVVSRYFSGQLGEPNRECSVQQLVRRVIGTLGTWGEEDGYFATKEDARVFTEELTYLMVHQMASFSSPVWSSVGNTPEPQTSPCFINGIRDDMESIMCLTAIETRLCRSGSGTSTNLSPLRAAQEPLSQGGSASGPVSFMRAFDAFAGITKSDVEANYPARMGILDVDHPDIFDFIRCKSAEQRKAWVLIDAGYNGSAGGEAYRSVAYQSTGLAVRVPDSFMKAVENDEDWQTRARADSRLIARVKARELLAEIARAAHECGDPGVLFESTINAWNTCAASGSVNASTPQYEFMFLDDSACNLASLNLLAYVNDDGDFAIAEFRHAVDLMIIAMDIIIDRSSYPTLEIKHNSHSYRPLSLGFSNLGAFLMACGLPYDSRRGRALAATITALMTGEAYAQSGRIAEKFGPFAQFRSNRDSLKRVVEKHAEALRALNTEGVKPELRHAALQCWKEAQLRATTHGVRNAQVTALASTRTISLVMDCETIGVEPDTALVKGRRVAGGESVMVVNRTLPLALKALGYERSQIRQIVDHTQEQSTIEGAPGLRAEHLAVFDCSRRAQSGRRSISAEGHLRMTAALQPFISGSIAKRISLPAGASVEDIHKIIFAAHQLGLKSISIQRDVPLKTQPAHNEAALQNEAYSSGPRRRRLPDERMSITHKFSIAGHEGYLTVGMYEDGSPGEIFIRMAKAGSVVAGLADSIGIIVSLALQYGVPLQELVDHYSHSRFEPSGLTNNPHIPIAKSIVDYIFRWLGMRFLDHDQAVPPGLDSSNSSIPAVD